ncbi:MAG TPA: hypothetical protein VHW01_08190 [Polyangiaceae bacterium]|nr:hypothetical protein [Polyangiaceae bacterium]
MRELRATPHGKDDERKRLHTTGVGRGTIVLEADPSPGRVPLVRASPLAPARDEDRARARALARLLSHRGEVRFDVRPAT